MRCCPLVVAIVPFSRRVSSRAAVSFSAGSAPQSRPRPPLSPQGLTRRLRGSRPVAWLIANAMSLALYQLCFEAACTGAIGWALLRGLSTPDDVSAWLRAWHYPLTGLVDWAGGHHETGLTFAGLHLDAPTLTALHTGHNIASGLLPLQIVVIAATYPAVVRCAGVAKGPLWAQWTRAKAAMGRAMPTPAPTPAPNVVHPFGKQQRQRRR